MVTWLSGANRSQGSAAFHTVGHRPKGAFFGGLGFIPAAMIIAKTIDVRFAIRCAPIRAEVACATTGAMRIGKTFHAIDAIAERRKRSARNEASGEVARIRRRITRAFAALAIFDAPDALRSLRSLSFAIRRIPAARITTHTATFVARAGFAYAAQTIAAITAIAILPAFSACRSNRTRQTERIPRLRIAIDDNGFEREAIDAGITATRGRIVFRERVHASAYRQVANATFALRIGRAFHTKRVPIRLDRGAIHLRAELTIRTTIARRSCTRIRGIARLAIFAVALFPLGTIRIIIAFVALFRRWIARESIHAIQVRATTAARQVSIEVHAERRCSAAR